MNQTLQVINKTDEALTTCINPANGEVIAEFRVNTVEELQSAVRNARAAQKIWARVPVKMRAKIILKIRDYIVDHADDIADCVCRDNGKTRTDAMITDVETTTMATS